MKPVLHSIKTGHQAWPVLRVRHLLSLCWVRTWSLLIWLAMLVCLFAHDLPHLHFSLLACYSMPFPTRQPAYAAKACLHYMQAPYAARIGRLPCYASQEGDSYSFYRLLEVSPNSSRAEIRAAYIDKIRTMHPDISSDSDATNDSVALNAAYAALMVQSSRPLVSKHVAVLLDMIPFLQHCCLSCKQQLSDKFCLDCDCCLFCTL